MKTLTYDNKVNIIYCIIMLFALSGILISGYFILTKHTIPECKAVTKAVNYTKEGRIETTLLVSVIPFGWKKLNIMLDGQVEQGGEKYTVSRLLIADYEYENENDLYHIRTRQTIRNPRDNVQDEEANRVMPGTAKDRFVKIEIINKSTICLLIIISRYLYAPKSAKICSLTA